MRTPFTALLAPAAAVLFLLAACGDDSSSSNPVPDGGGTPPPAPPPPPPPTDGGSDGSTSTETKRVILFVWDGLRPDAINATDTPNLDSLAKAGVTFKDNHSTYPTFTMMNAASFATGSFPASTGFYGNTLYAPGATGNDATGNPASFAQPIFTEDYGILEDLDAYYMNQLLLVGTLFQAAQKAGLTTAAIGKSGPAFLQDYKKGGIVLDEKMAMPLTLVKELQTAGFVLPKLTPNAYPAGMVTLAANNGDPTAAKPTRKLADNATPDPTDSLGSPHDAANQYMLGVYLDYILPEKKPDLTVLWFRTPDATEHSYGPGSPDFLDGLHAQDALLGQLETKLALLGLAGTTDIVVASDHGHTTVSGPTSLFPLRTGGSATGAVDAVGGYSVSGEVRLADLLTRAGFKAYDGFGCAYAPVLSGTKADGSAVYPVQTDDGSGTACGVPNKVYNTGSFKVPPTLPAKALVVSANGGSDYIYVPDHDMGTVTSVVSFLQSREEVGAIFVAKRYGALPGTIGLDTVRVENTAARTPDIVLSYTYDETQVVAGFQGIEYDGTTFNNRGMHGSFGPTDVHNTLVAFGPHFATAMSDTLPTGNVDVAPTIARIFGLAMPDANGRPLLEALKTGGAAATDYTVKAASIAPASAATALVMKLPTSPDGTDVDNAKTTYTIELATKTLTYQGTTWTYFDHAKAVRQ